MMVDYARLESLVRAGLKSAKLIRIVRHSDRQTGHFVAEVGGRLRTAFFDFGSILLRKSVELVARDVIAQLEQTD